MSLVIFTAHNSAEHCKPFTRYSLRYSFLCYEQQTSLTKSHGFSGFKVFLLCKSVVTSKCILMETTHLSSICTRERNRLSDMKPETFHDPCTTTIDILKVLLITCYDYGH